MQQSGFFWHVHHEVLLEWCYDYAGRAKHIRTYKSLGERGLRLRLFQPVKGQLPQEIVETRKAFDEALKTFNGAGKAYGEARRAYDKAVGWTARLKVWQRKDHDEAKKAYGEAERFYDKALKAFNEAKKAYGEAFSNYKDEIYTLHAQECLDCPWNGKTIFSAT